MRIKCRQDLAGQLKAEIRHANSEEMKKKLEVEGQRFRADGDEKKDGKEYIREFLEDYFHGNIVKYRTSKRLQKITPFTSGNKKPEKGKTFAQLYRETFERLQKQIHFNFL